MAIAETNPLGGSTAGYAPDLPQSSDSVRLYQICNGGPRYRMLAWWEMRKSFSAGQAVRAACVGITLAVVLLISFALVSKIAGGHLASKTAEFSLLATLLAIAAVVTLGTPVKMRKARVPVRRALPPAWWPPEEESNGLLALCLGGPIIVASAAAAIIFR